MALDTGYMITPVLSDATEWPNIILRSEVMCCVILFCPKSELYAESTICDLSDFT
jgi:hypothetical protein